MASYIVEYETFPSAYDPYVERGHYTTVIEARDVYEAELKAKAQFGNDPNTRVTSIR